jgi:pimeloyl-ACP methyl ester carboxylesterase
MLLRVALTCAIGWGTLQNAGIGFQHHTVTTGNGRLHAVEIGSGDPAVVFVPSLAGSWDQFADAARAVGARHRAVIVELRGHGQSTPPKDGDYSIDAYATDLATVVKDRRIGNSVLVGHSLGGGVALAYAAAHPGTVRALVLVDPIGDSSRTPPQEMAPFLAALEKDYDKTITGYWRTILKGANESVTSSVMAALAKTPRTTVIESMKASLRFEAVKAIEQYRGPILSVISEMNNFPFSLHVLVPRIRVHKMEGVSHWLQLDRPDEFIALLARTLQEYGR